jgi:hypothetical protein
MMHLISERWQISLAVLAPLAFAAWLATYGLELSSVASFFGLHLAVYMAHQIEEHLWPGGFRQFTNARVFETGRDDFPVTKGKVALVNIGMVWLPIAAVALFPERLYEVGVAWMGLSFVNSLSHIMTSARLRCYNPGVVTAALGLLPFSVAFFGHCLAAGTLSSAGVAAAVLAGVLLHVPVAALFVVPYRKAMAPGQAGLRGSV